VLYILISSFCLRSPKKIQFEIKIFVGGVQVVVRFFNGRTQAPIHHELKILVEISNPRVTHENKVNKFLFSLCVEACVDFAREKTSRCLNLKMGKTHYFGKKSVALIAYIL